MNPVTRYSPGIQRTQPRNEIEDNRRNSQNTHEELFQLGYNNNEVTFTPVRANDRYVRLSDVIQLEEDYRNIRINDQERSQYTCHLEYSQIQHSFTKVLSLLLASPEEQLRRSWQVICAFVDMYQTNH